MVHQFYTCSAYFAATIALHGTVLYIPKSRYIGASKMPVSIVAIHKASRFVAALLLFMKRHSAYETEDI